MILANASEDTAEKTQVENLIFDKAKLKNEESIKPLSTKDGKQINESNKSEVQIGLSSGTDPLAVDWVNGCLQNIERDSEVGSYLRTNESFITNGWL